MTTKKGRTKNVITDEEKEKLRALYRKFYADNKELLRKRNAMYNDINKEKSTKKIICECNGQYTLKSKYSHVKTRIHNNYLNKLKEKEAAKDKKSTTKNQHIKSDSSSDDSSSDSD